jgi:hypothetical protein
MKYSKVIPVYKANDPADINNYRPISLLPILSKIFEALILKRLTNFLNKYEILSEAQHGFRRGRSTTTATFQFVERI